MSAGSLREKKKTYEEKQKSESRALLVLLLLCILSAGVLLRLWFSGVLYFFILLFCSLLFFSLLFFVIPYYRHRHKAAAFEAELAALVADKGNHPEKDAFYKALCGMKTAPADWFGEVTLQFNFSTALFEKGDAAGALSLLQELEETAPEKVQRTIRLQKEAVEKAINKQGRA